MKVETHKIKNPLEDLVKELRDKDYYVKSFTYLGADIFFEIGKHSDLLGHYNPLGSIWISDRCKALKTELTIYGGKEFVKDKKKLLKIAKKYLVSEKD